MKAVIVGATGLVGRQVLQYLVLDPQITSIVSASRSSCGQMNSKLTEVIFNDIEELPSLTSQLEGHMYFCCLGTTMKVAGGKEAFLKVDQRAVVDFAKIAKINSAKSFVLVSSYGANEKSPFFYLQSKGKTERQVSEMGLESLSIFRPSFLVGHRKEFRPVEKISIAITKFVNPFLPQELNKKISTSVELLAQRMVTAAKRAEFGTVIIDASEI